MDRGVSGVGNEPDEDATGLTSLQRPGTAGVTLGTGTELVGVCGFPGVGKSTVSEHITEALGATRLRTDAVRKELFDEPTYSSAESRTVYEATFERARELLENGETVVVDASFSNEQYRDTATEVAVDCGVPFHLVKVDCAEETTVSRIERRDGISDADVAVYYEVRDGFDPIERDHVRIDNSGSWERTREQVDELLK
jgi:predicted kinase